jgi:small GTP-binding protein
MIRRESGAFKGRIVLIGDSAVGKTSILNRLVADIFNERESPTVGANFYNYTTTVDSLCVELQVWDTAGQETFQALGPIYYRGAVGAVAVFDITKPETFSALVSWITSFSDVAGTKTKIAIVGNKTDLEDDRKVGTNEASDWALQAGYLFFEASAQSGEGVSAIFEGIARAVSQLSPPQRENPPDLANPNRNGGCC